MKFILILIFFIYTCFFNTSLAFEQQGFTNFEDKNNHVSFLCEKQCFILLWTLDNNDYIELNWIIEWKGKIWYWFLNWIEIIPWNFFEISQNKNIKEKLVFSKFASFSQIPKQIQIVLIIDWNLKWDKIKIDLLNFNFIESFLNWFNEALEYREYNPRTINFLEWPMWNGKYINEAFFWLIIFLLFITIIWYFIIWKNKKYCIYFWVWVLAFFWIFFDFFSTVNEMKIWKNTISAKNIMENWRLGKTSDFYSFLDFIKTKVPSKEKWFFIAPYPFESEGKYHIYPDVKFDSINKVKYIFWYNPYWSQSPFNFKDPIYSSWVLSWDKYKFNVKEEINWKKYGKIYILK